MYIARRHYFTFFYLCIEEKMQPISRLLGTSCIRLFAIYLQYFIFKRVRSYANLNWEKVTTNRFVLKSKMLNLFNNNKRKLAEQINQPCL